MTDPGEASSNADVQRRLDAIIERFPDRFSMEQIAEIRTRVSETIAYGKKLSSLKLPNDVGPWFDPRSMADA